MPSQEEQVHARHILVATEEEAKALLARLAAGEDWAALAAELSTDTGSKDNAGDLGWFGRGVMVEAFETAAFALEVGETSDLVQSDYGYHIIQVLEKGMKDLDDATVRSQSSRKPFRPGLTSRKPKRTSPSPSSSPTIVPGPRSVWSLRAATWRLSNPHLVISDLTFSPTGCTMASVIAKDSHLQKRG